MSGGKEELAGLLRHRVSLLKRGPERDALGGAIGEWTVAGLAWAAIEPIGRREMPWWTVTLRREAPVPEIGDRIGWEGRTLALWVVIDDPRTPERIRFEAEELR